MNAPDTGADVGHAADAGAGHDPPDQTRLRQVADEQAALRRVATLVAGGAQPAEVFTAVADELARLIAADATFVSRVDPVHGEDEGRLTVVGSYGRVSDEVPVGFRISLEPGMIHSAALRTGRPARINGERLAAGPFGALVGRLGLRAAVATPIVVGGRRWGVTVAATAQEDFSPGTESRMADFMELAALAIANAQAEQDLRELADTQAALRRLATLVAQGEPPEAVFAAATREALRHFGGGTARMVRYEPDGTATLLANEGTTGAHVRIGERWEGYPPTGLTATVRQTGQAARVADYRDIPGGEPYLREGLRSAVAMPIHVNGRLWGMIAVGSGEGPLPPDTDQRMTEFTDLVATAVANAQNRAALEASRDELARLADEQAALRRVATLVALGGAPTELFAAVTGEAGQLLGAHLAGMARYESDHTVTVLATWAAAGEQHPLIPGPWPLDGGDLASAVLETGRPVRIADYNGIPGRIAAFVRDELGISSSIASPVVVEGRLWGVLFLHSKQARQPFPPDTESRLTGFTELVATAIANTESRAELAASRSRIVAAADEARRRIEHNLHDGAQQHLVTLALKLRSAAAAHESDEIRTEIMHVAAGLTSVIDELREISHGIHPAILSRAGLRPALRALGRRSAVPVNMDVRIEDRLPEPVEVAAYYVVSEMLTNAAKHARASVVEVEAETSGGTLRVCVRDDGAGGADPARGSGLTGLKDRIEALGGTFSLHSPASAGTTVSCELPVMADGGH